MLATDTAHVFLPCWRGGALLFFTDVKEGYGNRLEYRVAAAAAPGSTVVKRSHKAPINAAQLAACQAAADDGPGLQRFFQIMGAGNIGHLVDDALMPLPPCAAGSNPLIYTCSYLNLLRKYSVDQHIVKVYEAGDPDKRFNVDTSLSVYKILSAHLQPGRANALIDADIPDIDRISGAKTAVANLLREVAIIKFDIQDYPRATEIMHHAVGLHDTGDKWRRLADFSLADGKPADAIDNFAKAEAAAPLSAPPALRMATLLIEQNRYAEAEPYLARAEPDFAKPVAALRQKITTDTPVS